LLEFQKILDEKEFELKYYQEKYEKLNVIIDLIPNTISWINKDLTYFGVNQALAQTCGLTPSDFVGKKIGFHTKDSYFFEFATELFRLTQDTHYSELEVKINGKEKTFLIAGTKLTDKDKAIVIGVDITELKSLKGQISITEKLATLGEMFAGIIHDINNPLMMIEGNAKKLKRLTDDEAIHDIMNKIVMSSQKITKIVKGIKVFIHNSNPDSKELEKIGAIVEDAITICESKLKDKRVTLSYEKELSEISLKCNVTQIFQVFVNLITNAVDAISDLPDRFIEITIHEKSANQLVIYFTDSGAGIPDSIKDKIFQAFYTTKERGIGSGLGLSLCKKIMEAEKGNIEIVNNVPNTTFALTFKL
jgi:C4-dicarboxylate-specific signal transduction histidine kinase